MLESTYIGISNVVVNTSYTLRKWIIVPKSMDKYSIDMELTEDDSKNWIVADR